LTLLAHRAHLLAFGRGDGPVVIEIHRVEAGKRLRLELLLGNRLATSKRHVDHALDTLASLPSSSAARGFELSQCLLRFVPSDDTVAIGVHHLEHHVGALLRFGPSLVALTAARSLSQSRRRNESRAERD